MKYLVIVLFALSGLVVPQKKVLKGKYKMRFEKQYASQNGLITFDNNSYTRRDLNGKAIKGTIEYTDKLIILKDDNKIYMMEVSEKTIGKDTVQFRTVEVSKAAEKKPDVFFFPGRMVRQKDK